MNILMTGGTGFVGSALAARLAANGHKVTIASRRPPAEAKGRPGIRFRPVEPDSAASWRSLIADQDAIVNLAGASIFGRWTKARKAALRDSRLKTTRALVEALPGDGAGPVFLSASAVGYYGLRGAEDADESAPAGTDFLAVLSSDWETEALRAREKGARTVLIRLGIVLGPDGGALAPMVRLARWGLGGPLGRGRQWFSWIQLDDLTEAVLFLLGRHDASGPYNLTAPNPVRNRELARAIGRIVRRPSFLPAPAFAVRAVLGEFGSVLLEGRRVLPRRIEAAGFRFRHPELKGALAGLIA